MAKTKTKTFRQQVIETRTYTVNGARVSCPAIP